MTAMPAIVAASAGGRWREHPGLGVYVHIPFCRHRCHYCDFNTYEGMQDEHRPYVEALLSEIRNRDGEDLASAHSHGPFAASSVFFGGGTPTLLDPSDNASILAAVRDEIGLAEDAEVTIEANPETVDERHLSLLREAGFNRLSIGVQSLVPHVLVGLGRTHSASSALTAIAAAHRAGFTSVNADLIFGSPWETPSDWLRSLEGVVEAAPEHVSAYALTVEQGTPLATLVATKRVPDVDPDIQADRWEMASEVLGAAGYVRYEISNWARPKHASRHNTLYWSAGDYLGFGAGAHGHADGLRYWRTRLPRDYIKACGTGSSTVAGHEVLAGEARVREALVLGLRLATGIERSAFLRRFGWDALDPVEADITGLVELGLLQSDASGVRLAPAATLVADEALRRLL